MSEKLTHSDCRRDATSLSIKVVFGVVAMNIFYVQLSWFLMTGLISFLKTHFDIQLE